VHNSRDYRAGRREPAESFVDSTVAGGRCPLRY